MLLDSAYPISSAVLLPIFTLYFTPPTFCSVNPLNQIVDVWNP